MTRNADKAHSLDVSDGSREALLSRRSMLVRGTLGAASLLLPGALAACGSESSSGGSAPSAGSPAAATPSGTLDYIGWEGEDFHTAIGPFLNEHGVKLRPSAMASFDDALGKLQSGAADGTDLLGFSSSAIPRAVAQGQLQPIDPALIPNLENLLPEFAGDPPGSRGPSQVYDGEQRVFVPTIFSANGLVYDSAVVSTPPSSWFDVLEPEFKGKVGLYNDANVQFSAATQALGLRGDEVPKDGVQPVVELISKVLDQTKTVAPSVGDLVSQMISGDVVIAWAGYPGMNFYAAQGGKKTVKTALDLKEGAVTYFDGLAIPKGADNVGTAHAYINALLTPRTNASAANSIAAGPVVRGSAASLTPAVRGLYPTSGVRAFLARSPLQLLPPLESDEFVTQAEWAEKWNELTS
jgi:spermidine/putrescine transport system substrate-binding protein